MYASVIEMKFRSGMKQAAMEYAQGLRAAMQQIDGCNQMIVIDDGDDSAIAIAIYDSEAKQVAAADKAQSVMAGMAEFLASLPDRQGRSVLLNEKL